MKSICFFSSYFEGSTLPYYVRFYLRQIRPFFTECWLLTNEKDCDESTLQFLNDLDIKLKLYKNEGMDFGMWKKALGEFDVNTVQRIAFINDSCILFNSPDHFFTWLNQNDFTAAGMVLSGKISLHLQSYFLVFSHEAIPLVDSFKQIKLESSYKDVIYKCEIGLSEFLISGKISLHGFMDYAHEKTHNPTFILSKELIDRGCPLIKKKLFTLDFRLGDYLTWCRTNLDLTPENYINKIISVNKNDELIDFKKVLSEVKKTGEPFYYKCYPVALKLYAILHQSAILRFLFQRLIILKRRLSQ